MLPSNRCCKDTLKLLIGPFGASDTWLSLLLSFLFIQERVFLTISNYIFTAIFVSEMTLKVTFYNLSLFTASAGSKEMPSLFACFNWLAFSSQTEHTISFFFFYSQFPGSSGENSYAMSLISGWLLCIFPYLLHVSLFLFSPLLWFNFSRVWAVIFVILNLFVSLSFFFILLPHSFVPILCFLWKSVWHKWAINYVLPQSIINQSEPVKEPQTCQPPGQVVHVSLWACVYLQNVCRCTCLFNINLSIGFYHLFGCCIQDGVKKGGRRGNKIWHSRRNGQQSEASSGKILKLQKICLMYNAIFLYGFCRPYKSKEIQCFTKVSIHSSLPYKWLLSPNQTNLLGRTFFGLSQEWYSAISEECLFPCLFVTFKHKESF